MNIYLSLLWRREKKRNRKEKNEDRNCSYLSPCEFTYVLVLFPCSCSFSPLSAFKLQLPQFIMSKKAYEGLRLWTVIQVSSLIKSYILLNNNEGQSNSSFHQASYTLMWYDSHLFWPMDKDFWHSVLNANDKRIMYICNVLMAWDSGLWLIKESLSLTALEKLFSF